MEVFLALGLGLVIGYFRWLPARLSGLTDAVMRYSLVILLSAMGARIGADPRVMQGLAQLGLQAIMLATGSIAGSILLVGLLENRLKPHQEKTIAADPAGTAAGGFAWYVPGAVVLGMIGGFTLLPPDWVPWLERVATWALWLMIHAVGIDLGGNSASWKQVRRIGWNVLLVPLMIAVGSVAGAVITGFAAGLPVNEASAVGAGFGWYSLSGVLLTQVYHVQTGTLAFLTNVTREVMSFMIIPLLYRQGKTITCVAPGGATTMDTTLPVVTRVAGTEMAPLAFISGSTLTFLVPVLVPLLIRLPF